MKKICRLAAVTGWAATLSACMSPLQYPARAPYISHCPDVHVGMTFDEVSGLLGSPIKKVLENKNFDGSTSTAFQYIDHSVVHYTNGNVDNVGCM